MADLSVILRVHPVVLFQVIDAYERRNADSQTVLGTLLGSVENNIVEATNCITVPHRDNEEQVEMELTYALEMFDLNRKGHPDETIIGWWTTGDKVNKRSTIIHEYYTRECENPVHLVLDTSLKVGHMGMQAFCCIKMGVPGGKAGCMFTRIPVELTTSEPEIAGINLMQKAVGVAPVLRPKTVAPMLEFAQISEAASKLISLLELVLKYVDDVIAKKIEPDNAVGRQLLDLFHSVPLMSHEEFSQMFNANLRDHLMVITLSQLIKTQLQLTEKLIFLPTD